MYDHGSNFDDGYYSLNQLSKKVGIGYLTVQKIIKTTNTKPDKEREGTINWPRYTLETFSKAKEKYDKDKQARRYNPDEDGVAGSNYGQKKLEKLQEEVERLKLENANTRREMIPAKEVLSYLTYWKLEVMNILRDHYFARIPSETKVDRDKMDELFNEMVRALRSITTTWAKNNNIKEVSTAEDDKQ